jgi:ectoine hydroxylase-related dioxygenase (phytanoyl-CoA dioxygenase family)
MSNQLSDRYGILFADKTSNFIDVAVERIKILGYTVIDSGLSQNEIADISEAFNSCRIKYNSQYGIDYLAEIDEINTIRCMLAHGDSVFLRLALNSVVLQIISNLILGNFYLNQQNGIINPPKQNYNQGKWHRDLPYQHFITSSPIAINALYCVDDFTISNGATHILPATHKCINFPSDEFVANNSVYITAKAGSFIILDAMLYHKGGINQTNMDRRAINHVYSIPHIKQQICLPNMLLHMNLSATEKQLFGFSYLEYQNIDHFFQRGKIDAK